MGKRLQLSLPESLPSLSMLNLLCMYFVDDFILNVVASHNRLHILRLCSCLLSFFSLVTTV